MGEYLSKGAHTKTHKHSSTDLDDKVDHGRSALSPTVAIPHSGGRLLLLATHNMARGEPLEFLADFLQYFSG